MSKETVNYLLHFARHHVQQNGLIWFFGAEPFCGYDIMKYIVEKAISTPLSLKFGATTNCTLITEEIARWREAISSSTDEYIKRSARNAAVYDLAVKIREG